MTEQNPSLRSIILLGSSRSQGNTHRLASAIAPQLAAEVVDLNDYTIAAYDYQYQNQHDDFLPLIRHALSYDRLILASPMYWYAPSATMKVFMDRLSDLLDVEKPLGRQLRTKKAALLATGCDAVPPDCFEDCFRLTYRYLGMQYQGMLYASCPQDIQLTDHQQAMHAFLEKLHAE